MGLNPLLPGALASDPFVPIELRKVGRSGHVLENTQAEAMELGVVLGEPPSGEITEGMIVDISQLVASTKPVLDRHDRSICFDDDRRHDVR